MLTNGFTFTAVPSAIVHAGAAPVYVECTDAYVVDLDDLARKIEASSAKHFLEIVGPSGARLGQSNRDTLCAPGMDGAAMPLFGSQANPVERCVKIQAVSLSCQSPFRSKIYGLCAGRCWYQLAVVKLSVSWQM